MVDHDEMAQRLNRFWNAEVRRAPSNPDALDPTLAETVRRLRTCDDAPAPDPAFVARLGAALILPTPRSRSTGEGGGVVAPPSPVERERGAGGVTAERAREARGVRVDPPRGRPLRLVAAAILLLTLLAGAIVDRAVWPDHARVPAVPALALASPGASPLSFVATYRVTGDTPVNLRSVPAGGTVVKTLPPGTPLAFLDEEENAGGTIWLRVRTARGDVGWIAEEYVASFVGEPLPSATCPVTPGTGIPGAAAYFVPWGQGGSGVWLDGALAPGTPVSTNLTQGAVYAPTYGWLTRGLWVIAGDHTAPVTVQGHLLPNGGPPLLFQIVGNEVTATAVLDPQHPAIPVQHGDFREWPSYVIFPQSGCYVLTATWAGGGWRAVIRFVAPTTYHCTKLGEGKPIPCPATPPR